MRVRVDGSRPPRTRLARRVRAFGAFPLVMAPLAACTAGAATASLPAPVVSGLVPGATVPAGPAAREAASDALKTYNAYLSVYVTAAATIGGPTTAIDRYAADPLRQQAHLALRAYANAGVVLHGKPADNLTIVSVNVATSPHSVVIGDCVDASNWRPVVRKTGADATATNQPLRHQVFVTVVEYPHSVWYVQQIVDSAEPVC